LTALEQLVFYSSPPGGRAKQIVPALFSKTGGMRVKQLFKFRDQIAHPKPKAMEEEYETTAEDLESNFYENTKSEEEKFCSEANAKLCIERVEQMMELFFKQAMAKYESENTGENDSSFFENAPFIKSGQSGSAHYG
jgi:hypothetical protein